MKRVQILVGIAAAATASQALAQASLYPLPLSQRPDARAANGAPIYDRGQPQQVERAEHVPAGNFDRDRNVAVRERPRPEYDPEGIALGGFTAYPKLTVGAERDDNVGATPFNTEEDTIYVVSPELVLERTTADTHVEAFVRGSRRMNEDFVKESTTDYEAGLSGHYDAGSGIRLTGGGDYGRYTEPRTSTLTPGGTVKQIEYKLEQEHFGLAWTMDRLRLTGLVDRQVHNFHDGYDAANTEVDQDFRDREIITYSARAEYALTPETSIFLVSAFDDRRYDRQPPAVALNRDSKGKDIAIGAAFDLSALARGEIQLGYGEQDYANLTDVKGMTGKAVLEWFPTDLTTLTLTGSRAVRDATVAGAGGFMAGDYALQIDQELLRNLIVTARVGYGRDDYKGIDRKDERTTGYVGANYLLNRKVGFTLAYDYLKQESAGAAAGNTFEDNKVSLSSSLQF